MLMAIYMIFQLLEAIDPAELDRAYTETDIPIEVEEETETE